jgi:hypothetical protein
LGERLKLRLSSLVTLAAILGFVMLVAGCILAGKGGLLNLLYPLGALLVGVLLYLRHPALYVGFVWWLWFLTPEVRRFVDWQSGWHPQSTVMLAPHLVAGLTLFTLLRHSPKLELKHLFPFVLVFVGLLYGFAVGFFMVGLPGATYDLLVWTVPVLTAFYLVVHWRNYPDYRHVTQRTFSWGLLVIGLYGLLQFFDPPAWDQFWMNHVEMDSIGEPEPFKVRVFSTLNSPGPLSTVIMAGLLVLLSGGGLLRWPALVAGGVGFALSLVRSYWGAFVVGLCVLAAQYRGRFRLQLLATLIVVGLIVYPLLSFGPLAEVVSERLRTFGDVQADSSWGDRLSLYLEYTPQALGDPVGKGLGSVGEVTKLSTEGGALGQFGKFDSGLLQIPLVLGWPGTLLYVGGLIWLLYYALLRTEQADLFAVASRGIVAAMLAASLSGPVVSGVVGMVLWYFLGLAVAARVFYAQNAKLAGQQSGSERPALKTDTGGS